MGEFMYLFFQLWCQIIRFQENEKETVFILNSGKKKDQFNISTIDINILHFEYEVSKNQQMKTNCTD